jgi:MFS family permease
MPAPGARRPSRRPRTREMQGGTGEDAASGLHRWRDPPLLALALAALAAGFGQFGAVAALGDVARTFGDTTGGTSLSDQAGLSGTQLGLGLAILRLASLVALPLTGLADRLGRRRVLLTMCASGLVLTAIAAASPGYWWFVAVFALGRPLLSTTAAVAEVAAAEDTGTHDRAKAVALIAAAYGVGSGLTAIIYSLWADTLGFRGVFLLALVAMGVLPWVARHVHETGRYQRAVAAGERGVPVLGAVGPRFRGRLVVVCALAFAVSVVTGPVNSFIYLYAENIVGLAGGVVAAMVVAAGATGLAGLLLGRWLADRLGRRITAAGAIIAVVGCGVLAYSGSAAALVVGYVVGVFAASAFAPAAGALVNELFPTSVRASVAGWHIATGVFGAVTGLVVFGAIADAGDEFGLAALATFIPVIAATALFALVPETAGTEPEELWPDQA